MGEPVIDACKNCGKPVPEDEAFCVDYHDTCWREWCARPGPRPPVVIGLNYGRAPLGYYPEPDPNATHVPAAEHWTLEEAFVYALAKHVGRAHNRSGLAHAFETRVEAMRDAARGPRQRAADAAELERIDAAYGRGSAIAAACRHLMRDARPALVIPCREWPTLASDGGT
jgi:hypothetical protein